MGRRSSGKSSSPSRGFASRPAPAAPRSSAPAPHAAAQPPAPAQSSGGFMDLASNIVGGMASGVGFSVANRAVDAVLGPRQVDMVHRTEDAAPAAPAAAAMPVQQLNSMCQIPQEQLNQCLSQAGDMSHCNYYFDMLKQCQQGGRA